MTLETCKSQLAHYKAQGNAKQVAFWEARLLRKSPKPVVPEPKEKPKNVKKPKR